MNTTIYCSYKELPASIIAQEQLEKAKEVFELTYQAIKANLKKAEDEFVKQRTLARQSAEWDYFMSPSVENEFGLHYHIHRSAKNPQLGDTLFYRDISYCSFKIVNNVLILSGSGSNFQQLKTGDILTDNEISELNLGIVPDRFKNKPIINSDNRYLTAS